MLQSSRVLLLLVVLIVFLEIRQFYNGYVFTTSSSHHPKGMIEKRPRPLQKNNNPQPRAIPVPVPRRADNNSTFSACLLVMDDNHFLIEWLAYHYQTLPLRYLVIAMDPRSRTSPKSILDRWEPYMTIVRWSDRRFLPKEWLNRAPAEDDPTAKLMKHRERQRHFYPTCFEHLKEVGREWTMVIDSDEFATQNPHYALNNATTRYPTLLQSIQSLPQYHNASCITMPRLRFGNFEDGNSTSIQQAPPGFVDRDFLTQRWRWRAGLHNKKDNKHPKSMIDLKRIANFSRQDTDAHRPVRSECPKRNMYILNRESPFSVHHYVGSQEQFGFRRDAREGTKTRNGAKLDEYGQVRDDLDDTIGGWLKEFVQEHGYERAKALLEGVGNVSFSPSRF